MKTNYKSAAVISVYLACLGAVVISLFIVSQTIKLSGSTNQQLSYVTNIVSDYTPVNSTISEDKIIMPYLNEGIEIAKHFYDKEAEAKVQENAIIQFQNSYMQNTGILYKAAEAFDVLSVLEGTVEEVTSDEVMGNIVTIKHTDNLRTTYQSLGEISVEVGSVLKQGDIIGVSGPNKIMTDTENMLLFEVEYKGKNINPDTFYKMKIEELS